MPIKEEFQNQDCTGSVISERFVLTSETCVPDGDWLSYRVKVVYGEDEDTSYFKTKAFFILGVQNISFVHRGWNFESLAAGAGGEVRNKVDILRHRVKMILYIFVSICLIFAIKDDGNIERNVAIIVVNKKVRNKAIKTIFGSCFLLFLNNTHSIISEFLIVKLRLRSGSRSGSHTGAHSGSLWLTLALAL